MNAVDKCNCATTFPFSSEQSKVENSNADLSHSCTKENYCTSTPNYGCHRQLFFPYCGSVVKKIDGINEERQLAQILSNQVLF